MPGPERSKAEVRLESVGEPPFPGADEPGPAPAQRDSPEAPEKERIRAPEKMRDGKSCPLLPGKGGSVPERFRRQALTCSGVLPPLSSQAPSRVLIAEQGCVSYGLFYERVVPGLLRNREREDRRAGRDFTRLQGEHEIEHREGRLRTQIRIVDVEGMTAVSNVRVGGALGLPVRDRE